MGLLPLCCRVRQSPQEGKEWPYDRGNGKSTNTTTSTITWVSHNTFLSDSCCLMVPQISADWLEILFAWFTEILAVCRCNFSHWELWHCGYKECRVSLQRQSLGRWILKPKRATALTLRTLAHCSKTVTVPVLSLAGVLRVNAESAQAAEGAMPLTSTFRIV